MRLWRRGDSGLSDAAEGLKQVHFRYRGHGVDGKLTGWNSHWATTGVLPEWIEVAVTPETGPEWPPIRVRLPLAGSAQ